MKDTKVTMYKSIFSKDPYTVTLEKTLERIKNEKTIETINKIRSVESHNEKNDIKKTLPIICFSGTFAGERNSSIVGIISISFTLLSFFSFTFLSFIALPLDYESIAYDLRMDSEVIKSIINDFDLFVIDGDIFGSNSIQRRLEERESKSTNARKSATSATDDC